MSVLPRDLAIIVAVEEPEQRVRDARAVESQEATNPAVDFLWQVGDETRSRLILKGHPAYVLTHHKLLLIGFRV